MDPTLPRPASRPRLLCLTDRRPLPPTCSFRVPPLFAAFYRSPPLPPAGSSCVPPLAAASRLPCPGSCRRLLPLSTHFLGYTICNSFRKAPLLIIDTRFDVPCARIVKYYPLKRFVDETGKLPVEWGKAHDEKMIHYSSWVQANNACLGIFDQVSVFGFGKSSEAKHHYYTNQKTELDLHDFNGGRRWREMGQLGKREAAVGDGTRTAVSERRDVGGRRRRRAAGQGTQDGEVHR